jgi:outer membrane PBP1 activator LpoA protein
MPKKSLKASIIAIAVVVVAFIAVVIVLSANKNEQQGNIDIAEELAEETSYEKLYSANVDNAKSPDERTNAILEQAYYYVRVKDYDTAERIINQIVETSIVEDAKKAEYYNLRAEISIGQKNYKQSVVYIEQLLSTDTIKNSETGSKNWMNILEQVKLDRDPYVTNTTADEER